MFIYPSRYHIEAHTPKSKLLSLGCSAFARRYSQNRIRFLFLCLLRCFTSAGFALWMLFIHTTVTGFKAQLGFPIRKSPDQSLFPTDRSLSQVTTSFIASRHQGIHLAPFVAYQMYLILFTIINVLWRQQSCTVQHFDQCLIHARISKNHGGAPFFRGRAPRQKVIGHGWWARLDLNQRPRAYQARALTN